jgi:hypothetical protein
MEHGDRFETIQAAKEAINRYVLDNGESFKVEWSEKSSIILSAKSLVVGLVFELQLRERKWFQSLVLSPIYVALLSTTTIDEHTQFPT